MMAIVFACGVTFAIPVNTPDEKPKTEQACKDKKDKKCCAEKKEACAEKKACDDTAKKACCDKKADKSKKTE
ncbi:hypothetical protein C8N47_103134 [Mangrovibacterium marinum]|uniref:Uncharacterized protein n=2 Tax=Mangrovibacterium marinum TaxID=1639118 RepID=A0A2T5C4Q6_9BACT|nr:hypothetical protein C8N47_103134 [Mangrovibacterium marinum]